MAVSGNPFQHLIPDQPESSEQQNPFQKFIPQEQKPEMVDTFLGQIPKNSKELQPGTPEYKGNLENMISTMAGAPAMKVAGTGVTNFGKGIMSLFNRIAPKELAYGVQKAHDAMLNKLSGMYNYVKDEALKRGIGKIKIPDALFEQAEKHLPNTEAYKDLLTKAKTGDYEALHQLQSDLGKKGTLAKGAKYHADRNIGEEMLDTRKQINREIQSQLKGTGNDDLADLLGQASKGYRNYKKLYYTDRGIANLVHEDSRLVPKNPFNLFSKESKPMSRILDAHPEIRKALGNEETVKSFMKGLNTGKKVATTAGIAGGGLYTYNTIANLLRHIGGED